MSRYLKDKIFNEYDKEEFQRLAELKMVKDEAEIIRKYNENPEQFWKDIWTEQQTEKLLIKRSKK